MSSRTSLNPCVTAVDSEILRSGPSTQPFNPQFFFIWSYLKEDGKKRDLLLFFRRPNVEKPKRTWCAIIPRTLLIADLRVCPRQKKNWQSSRREKKRRSLLTLHARGYSVESNSQGYRYICIPLEEEDKLNQHLTSTPRLLDVGEQNESFLI